MMARRFASGFAFRRQAHSFSYGREVGAQIRRKTAASARVGAQHRLMNYLGYKLMRRFTGFRREFLAHLAGAPEHQSGDQRN